MRQAESEMGAGERPVLQVRVKVRPAMQRLPYYPNVVLRIQLAVSHGEAARMQSPLREQFRDMHVLESFRQPNHQVPVLGSEKLLVKVPDLIETASPHDQRRGIYALALKEQVPSNPAAH